MTIYAYMYVNAHLTDSSNTACVRALNSSFVIATEFILYVVVCLFFMYNRPIAYNGTL